MTVADRLRVRSQPRISDDSIMYDPVLPLGTALYVLDGPVSASGYTWYEVSPVSFAGLAGPGFGWVAKADRGGEPWIAPATGLLADLALARSTVPRAAADPAAAKTVSAAIDAFGLDLYRAMLADPGLKLADRNVVFSPTSIEIALAMADAGARGDTASQMDRVLGSPGWDAFGTELSALDQILRSRDATWQDNDGTAHELTLRIANGSFGQRGYAIEQAYLDAIGEAFGAGQGLVDYAADPEAARLAINQWVSDQTAQRIKELLLPPDITADTRIALVNAIYLKANWLEEFAPADTRSARFTRLDASSVTVPTMSLKGDWLIPYAKGSGWQATELPYMGGNDGSTPLVMTLILPDEISSFESGFAKATLEGITTTLATERTKLGNFQMSGNPSCPSYAYSVNLFMPRFGIDTRAGLAPVLAKLGMQDPFDPLLADFSGITPQESLFISKVIHQANIDVDEKGTEAAAATAVVIGDTAAECPPPAPRRNIVLRLDHPFLFALRDTETGAVLFMGRVVDPSVRN